MRGFTVVHLMHNIDQLVLLVDIEHNHHSSPIHVSGLHYMQGTNLSSNFIPNNQQLQIFAENEFLNRVFIINNCR